MKRSWTKDQERRLRRDYGRVPTPEIARAFGKTVKAVTSRAKKLKLRTREPLGQAEKFVMRLLHGHFDAARIAQIVGLSIGTVQRFNHREGLVLVARIPFTDQVAAFVREKHALGWGDAEIGAASTLVAGRAVSRKTVTYWREKLGLPTVVWPEHQRAKTRAKTAEQLKKAGIANLGLLRVEAFKKFARDSGWPEDLQVREVQILNCMWGRGPMTKRQLVEALGMPWKGSRKSLLGNRAGGSYLATLQRRGMVVSLGRIVKHADAGKGNRAGQSRNTVLYSLSPTIQRRKVNPNDREQQPAGVQASAGDGQAAGGRRDGAATAVAAGDADGDQRAA